jgi:DNA-binding SARP family transcriptional activator
VRADLDLGRPGAAVARLEELVAAAPFRERRRELLVEALHQAGRAGDALAAVATYRRLLAEELGLDPGPGIRRLEASVLAGEPVAAPGETANAPFVALDVLGRHVGDSRVIGAWPRQAVWGRRVL